METARHVYQSMMRTLVAPALRSFGFKGSGQVFRLPAEGYWAILAFQKSQHNDATRVRFTINLTVAEEATWSAARKRNQQLPEAPSGTVFYEPVAGPIAWETRIGRLLPKREDTWWEVTPDSKPDRVAADLLKAIEKYALPAMREQLHLT